jgi:hypothetical protein
MADPVNPVDPAKPTGDGNSFLERMQRGMKNSDPETAKKFAETLERMVSEGKEVRKAEEAKKAERLTGVSEYKPRTSGGGGGGGMGGNKLSNRDLTKAYKAGGKVSSASKRGDGCAIKGKTKGRMI